MYICRHTIEETAIFIKIYGLSYAEMYVECYVLLFIERSIKLFEKLGNGNEREKETCRFFLWIFIAGFLFVIELICEEKQI